MAASLWEVCGRSPSLTGAAGTFSLRLLFVLLSLLSDIPTPVSSSSANSPELPGSLSILTAQSGKGPCASLQL